MGPCGNALANPVGPRTEARRPIEGPAPAAEPGRDTTPRKRDAETALQSSPEIRTGGSGPPSPQESEGEVFPNSLVE
eukprot:11190877-Lingulodinium_polyedra.AAC.1